MTKKEISIEPQMFEEWDPIFNSNSQISSINNINEINESF